MKRCLSMLLAVVLLLACINISPITAHAATKKEPKRAISVVFDNSGSMYQNNNQAWCRATYATEVFAAMLNEGDELQIYPMNPITSLGKQYTMESPMVIKSPKEGVEKIHDIFTPHETGTLTNIESIDYAAAGLRANKTADEKYLVILTDGTNFYEGQKNIDGQGASTKQTKKSKAALEARISNLVGDMTVMYLGMDDVGVPAVIPQVNSSAYVWKRAEKSEDVLAALTDLCNMIFGRDSLPAKYKSEKSIKFDISMKKMIVFVQGQNIDGLKVVDKSGSPVGKLVSTQQTKYSEKGTGKSSLDNNPDTSLQGMIVTYEGCAAGEYDVKFSGTQTSIEVYYEPDADLSFVFTDAKGKKVDPKALYEGTYKVSFGMKDAKTGQLIESDLLGKPSYAGTYTRNGKTETFTADGYSGNIDVTLDMGDTFKADLTVTYLSGYTIFKDSSDFGWPEGGIKVVARPAGDLVMKLEGGQDQYSLQKLEEGQPFKATLFYADKQLTGEELKKVELYWDPEVSNALLTKDVKDDHIDIILGYKDPNAPQDTKAGSCTVPIQAVYQAKGDSPSQTEELLQYYIDDDFSPLVIDLYAQESYVVIAEMANTPPLIAELWMQGEKLTAEQFAAVKPTVDIGGVPFELKAEPENSRYLIYLKQDDGAAEGDYTVSFSAQYTDNIGRTTSQEDEVSITLSAVALWKKVLFWSLAILLALILLILILRIRVFPSPVTTKKRDCELIYDNDVIENGATFQVERSGKDLKAQCKFNGDKYAVSLGEIEPGKKSFLCKSSKKRTILVKLHNLKKVGPADITDVNVAGTQYEKDENGKLMPLDLNTKTRELRNGDKITFSGTILNAGVPVDFAVSIQVNYKK